MKHSVDHKLAPDQAKALLGRALDTYRESYKEYDVETAWVADDTAEVGFKITGSRIGGRIKICEDCFDIDVKVPWLFRPFRKRITRTVDQEFRRWLEHA